MTIPPKHVRTAGMRLEILHGKHTVVKKYNLLRSYGIQYGAGFPVVPHDRNRGRTAILRLTELGNPFMVNAF